MLRKLFTFSLGIAFIIGLCGCESNIDEPVNSLPMSGIATDNEETEAADLGNLRIIGSYHEDMVRSLSERFEKEYGCKVTYVYMATGDAEAKLIAEKQHPTCDVWIGGTVDAHEMLKEQGILKSCHVAEEKNYPTKYLDPDGVWKSQYVEVLSIGVNTKRFEEKFASKGIRQPVTLEGLLNPQFKGEIVMPEPTTSGTGYTILASVLDTMGEEEGWDYLEQLNTMVGQYTTSGYTSAEKVGLGEYSICLNFLSDQLLVQSYGYPLSTCVYNDAGWSAVPVSLIAGAEDNPYATQFINFALAKEACNMLVSLGCVTALRPDCDIPKGAKAFDELPISRSFNPVRAALYRRERIKRFGSFMM